MKATNNYMNNFIRGKSDLDNIIWRYKDGRRIPIKTDYAYHYGDLGKARDTYYWNINSSNRSTGHFGTGTYFLSKEAKEEYDGWSTFSRSERPINKINFNEYDLFKVKTDTDAYLLHNGLKAVNYLYNLDNSSFEAMRQMLVRYNINSNDITNAFNKAKDIYYTQEYQNASYDSKLDSLSTIFMKELGFNGIDVRGINSYDNTTYGSVIYDLNKKKNKGGK